MLPLRFVVLVLLFGGCISQSPLVFTVDGSSTQPWNHYWELCVGSDHAHQALRADYQAALRRAHDECGFQYVRMHGILDDDMSVVFEDPFTGETVYSFYNIDTVIDFLLSIHMKPLVELSFMPQLLASGTQTVFHYEANVTPPKNYTSWAVLITAVASHLVERYGEEEVASWYFEVWNEPNGGGFWNGTQADYFLLYQTTATALKSVSTHLRVGGPATAGSQWIPEFMAFIKNHSVPIDFVSTHLYPTDPEWGAQNRSTMVDVATYIKGLVGSLPLFYTEYNSGLAPFMTPAQHDTSYAAAFVVMNVANLGGVVDILSYWDFSDIFEEDGFFSTPFHGTTDGYGLLNVNGIAKPAYRAFQLLHATGNERVEVTPSAGYATVSLLATRSHEQLQLLVSNFQVLNGSISTETVSIMVEGLSIEKCSLQRIDPENANPAARWVAMGSPTYPTRSQLAELDAASQLKSSAISVGKEQTLQFSIPGQGVAAVFCSIS